MTYLMLSFGFFSGIKSKKESYVYGILFLVSDNIVLIECKEEFSKDLNM